MVDIVKMMADQVAIWQEEEKCGLCWHFEAPQRVSDMNESVMKTDECCVRVFLTNYRIDKNRSYGVQNPFHYNSKTLVHNFDLYFVLPDRVDINVYSEQENHPLSESKWSKILKPLLMCLDDFDFCETLDAPLRYNSENWSIVMDFLDDNYSGWLVRYSLIENLEL